MALTTATRGSSGEQGVEAGNGGDGGGGGGGAGREEMQWEHMFDKEVTPSDVGKLNRLVLPKHFAERYFPLDPAAARAGAVLRFEDAGGGGTGKAWRFRLSYWSSSQSYVMTKGWSGFVRDKRLAAGDTISFCRAGARLFIDCRRRGAATTVVPALPPQALTVQRLVTTSDEARGRCLRLFGVDLKLGAEPPPPPLELQLALR